MTDLPELPPLPLVGDHSISGANWPLDFERVFGSFKDTRLRSFLLSGQFALEMEWSLEKPMLQAACVTGYVYRFRPQHVCWDLHHLIAVLVGDSLIFFSRRSPGRPGSRNRRWVDWGKPRRTES